MRLFFCSIALVTITASAQTAFDFTLKGTAQQKRGKEFSKIYYTVKGEAFTSKRSIPVATDGSYEFVLSKSIYKKLKTGVLYFTRDSTESLDDMCANVETIFVDSIYKYSTIRKIQTILIPADMTFEGRCRMADDMSGKIPHPLVGKYSYKSHDSLFVVTIYDGYQLGLVSEYTSPDGLLRHIENGKMKPDTPGVGQITVIYNRRANLTFGTQELVTRTALFSYTTTDHVATIMDNKGTTWSTIIE